MDRKSLHVKEIADPKFCKRPRILKLYKPGGILARYKRWELKREAPSMPGVPISMEGVEIPLYDYQESIEERAMQALNEGSLSYFLVLATGMGKTRIALSILSHLSQRALIVVPTVNLAQQWLDEVRDLLPMSRAGIGAAKSESMDICICVINTARSRDEPFFSGFGLIIFDEVHEYTSDCSKEALWKGNLCRYMLGLSATPETGDGLLPFLEGHLGPIHREEVESVKYKTNVWVVHHHAVEAYAAPILNDRGIISSMASIQRILEDEDRMKRILSCIRKIYFLHEDQKMGMRLGLRDANGTELHRHKIFVFCEFRDHLSLLKERLAQQGIYAEEEISILMGGSKREDSTSAREGRVVLTTYGYSKRGVSFDDFTALVMVTPRKKQYVVEQLLGRIYRVKGPREVTRIVVDIVDVATPFRHQFKVRESIYEAREYKLCTVAPPREASMEA